jgi:HrpA-like RNA helicase
VPQYLWESGLAEEGLIAITQPRRVAATSLAVRVAAEQQVVLGGLVGYSVRFDEALSSETRIKYVTDGMLVRELLTDPLLSCYSVVIVDEAHERTLRTDILIANLKIIQKTRNTAKGKASTPHLSPLKVVIMSATLDAEIFSTFFSKSVRWPVRISSFDHTFNSSKIIYVKGRQHAVKIFHASVSQTDYVDAALRTFFQIHIDQPPGDVLIFLPGNCFSTIVHVGGAQTAC